MFRIVLVVYFFTHIPFSSKLNISRNCRTGDRMKKWTQKVNPNQLQSSKLHKRRSHFQQNKKIALLVTLRSDWDSLSIIVEIQKPFPSSCFDLSLVQVSSNFFTIQFLAVLFLYRDRAVFISIQYQRSKTIELQRSTQPEMNSQNSSMSTVKTVRNITEINPMSTVRNDR